MNRLFFLVAIMISIHMTTTGCLKLKLGRSFKIPLKYDEQQRTPPARPPAERGRSRRASDGKKKSPGMGKK
jgi:hypothetical protein